MLTRSSFGAYDADTWTIQWILQNLDYDPGPLDGLWGSRTWDAASDFRNLNGLPPASGFGKAGMVDDTFRNALWGAVLEYDLDVPGAPTSGVSGGTSTTPRATGTGATPTAPRGTVGAGTGGTTPISSGIDMTMILALGAVGLGAILLYGGKKGRR
jgi:hypothetical protein